MNKDKLHFDLNPSDFPDSVNGYGKSECVISARNLSNEYLAIRVKTTRKEVYMLNPTYSLVKPNESIEIKFTYIIKDIQENPDKHKFKFEGIVVPEEFVNKDTKAIFDHFIKNKIPVKGYTIKLGVSFTNIKLSKTTYRDSRTREIEVNRSLNPNSMIYENTKEDE